MLHLNEFSFVLQIRSNKIVCLHYVLQHMHSQRTELFAKEINLCVCFFFFLLPVGASVLTVRFGCNLTIFSQCLLYGFVVCINCSHLFSIDFSCHDCCSYISFYFLAMFFALFCPPPFFHTPAFSRSRYTLSHFHPSILSFCPSTSGNELRLIVGTRTSASKDKSELN